jgi:flagellar FliL protein
MSEATADESVEEELTEGEEEEQASAGGSGRTRLLLIVGLVVLVLAGAGAGAYFGGLFDMSGEDEQPRKVETNVVFYDLPEMVVNINAGAKKQAFLKIQLSLELDESQDLVLLERLMPRVVDHFQVYLRELRADDLHGSAGIYRLKEELLRRIIVAAHPVEVRDVLFKEMLIQ